MNYWIKRLIFLKEFCCLMYSHTIHFTYLDFACIYTYSSPTEYKNKLIHIINLLYICMFFIQTCVRKFEKMKNHTSLRLGPGARTELDKICIF